MEFGYIDLVDPDTGEYYINPSIEDKDSVTHIQDFRVGRVVAHDAEGNSKVYQFRGMSGWYFQASASTSAININVTAQSELDPTFRSSWLNLVDYWYNRPQFVTPPVHDGREFYGVDYLFRGQTVYEGHSFTNLSDGYVDSNGNYVFPKTDFFGGPMRMSYIYGEHGDTKFRGATKPVLNHTLKFASRGKCTVQLQGRTPIINKWSPNGSWVPQNKQTMMTLKPGSDNLIIIDGKLAIRVRLNGWHAHYGDHVFKPSWSYNTAVFAAGNYITWGNGLALNCEGDFYGDQSYLIGSDADGNTTYGNVIEFRSGLLYWLKQWLQSNPEKGLDIYNVKATLKAWKKLPPSDDPTKPPKAQAVADPYKVLINTGSSADDGLFVTPPDVILYTQAAVRKSVYEFNERPELFGCNPTYSEDVGFLFSLPEPVDKYSYGYIEWTYDGVLIGARMFDGTLFGYLDPYNSQTPQWRKTDYSIFGDYNGDLPVPSTDPDPDNEGYPNGGTNDAALICVPFGPNNTSFLPTCGIYITEKGVAGSPYTFIPHSSLTKVNSGGASVIQAVTLDWGDGSADACTLDTPVKHQWDAAGDYTISMQVTYTESSGRGTDRSKTYIKVSP